MPLVAGRPALPASSGDAWDRWTDDFSERTLSPEWLRIRNPGAAQDHALENGELLLAPGHDPAGSLGAPAFLGKRLRHPAAAYTTSVSFAPDKSGDFAGLLAFMDETHFIAFGIEGTGGGERLVARRRTDAKQDERGEVVAQAPLSRQRPARTAHRHRRRQCGAELAQAGRRWQVLAPKVDVEPLASVHAGLFTGLVVGPYALAGN